MTELTQILNYVTYGLILALALVLIKNMVAQFLAYKDKTISKSELMTRTAMRAFILLLCVWGAFAVQKISPKTTLTAPSLAQRVESGAPAKPAPEVVKIDDAPQKLSQNPAKLREQIRSDFNKLPDDQGAKP